MDKVEGDKRVYYLVPQEEYEKTKRLYYAFFKLNNLSSRYLSHIRIRKNNEIWNNMESDLWKN